MTIRTRTGTCAAVAALALVGLLGACGGSDDSGGESTAGAPAAPGSGAEAGGDSGGISKSPGAGAAADESGGGSGSSGSSGSSGASAVPGTQRRVRSAEVTVEVGNLGNAAARVRATATGLGGFVSSESTGLATSATPPTYSTTEEQDTPSTARPASNGESVIVLRVPEPQLDEALGRIAATGKELSRTSSSQDVTAAIADIDSRVATQKRSVERVRALLGRATTLNEIVMLESELAKRESDLEAVQASQRSLTDRADLATVTAVLRTPEVAAQTVEADDDEGFLAGLEQGWDAVVASTTVVLTVLGALLPITVVLAVIGLPVFLLRRRRRISTP
jgi:PIN domain nuclease of toxin-antitoxin system